MSEIEAVLFDYGGVLSEEGFSNTLEALAKEQDLPVEDMTAEGMQAVYDTGFVLGRGNESDFWSLFFLAPISIAMRKYSQKGG